MINKSIVAGRLSELRKSHGYSQAKLSELLHISPQAVSKWENGIAMPDIEALLSLSWIYRISINEILDGDDYMEGNVGIDREYLRMNHFLICPDCKQALRLCLENGANLVYQCASGHTYPVIDGVVDFKMREIIGEQWSDFYRNYNEYLSCQTHDYHNPNYDRGIDRNEIIWPEIESRKPKTILDMACGMGTGIKSQIKKIEWPVTIIMADLSHRIQKWNKSYFETVWKNPYVDMVFLACDGARLPICDKSVDMVFSYWGFESMQDKMQQGFREAERVLRPGGVCIYTKAVVENINGENTNQWMKLMFSMLNEKEKKWCEEQCMDLRMWCDICRLFGFSRNTYTKIYDELPAPHTNLFPYSNEIMQWMAEYVFVSEKSRHFTLS